VRAFIIASTIERSFCKLGDRKNNDVDPNIDTHLGETNAISSQCSWRACRRRAHRKRFGSGIAEWPTRTVQVISQFSAGNATDIVARIVLDQAFRQMGQSCH
jgi:hypothetical protein